MHPPGTVVRSTTMPECRIFYFRGGILEDSSEPLSDGVLEAARTASSTHPHLTAEIWVDGHKAAIVRPTWHQPIGRKARVPPRREP
jgi:hypothetical protein